MPVYPFRLLEAQAPGRGGRPFRDGGEHLQSVSGRLDWAPPPVSGPAAGWHIKLELGNGVCLRLSRGRRSLTAKESEAEAVSPRKRRGRTVYPSCEAPEEKQGRHPNNRVEPFEGVLRS